MNKIEVYAELLKIANANREVVSTRIIDDLSDCLDNAHVEKLFGMELEKYGPLHYRVKGCWNDWFRILYYYKGSSGLSWPDDNKQPCDEWGYVMSFTTGAYIFGDSYPKDTFNAMFQELKDMGAKYSDSVNHCLVFPPEVAKNVVESYPEIYKKYAAMVQSEVNAKRKLELQEELDKLNNEG